MNYSYKSELSADIIESTWRSFAHKYILKGVARTFSIKA
jgi:hypothetical protein